MSQKILINVTPQEVRAAIVEDGVLQELHIERSSSLGLVGNIYRGEVCRVLPGMQSAFVEISLQRAAFLHATDILECVASYADGEKQKAIQEVLHEGQSLIVQVLKEPMGSKGARLTTQISIAGRFLVYLPQQENIGVSQRIEDEAKRELLRDRLIRLLPKGRQGGYIIRTMSEAATDEELLADIDYLQKAWANIQVASQNVANRSLVFQDLDLPMRALRDVMGEETDRILVDSRETYQKLLEFAEHYSINVAKRLEHYQGEQPLFDMHNIENEIKKAALRKVELKSGGYLIIDQTEALTTVDVNTGSYVNGSSLSDTIFKTNLEACLCIARQLRLRNLGGIIIIDFIDMHEDGQHEVVLEELQKAIAKDRARITMHGFSALGLVEMTRKRTRGSLAHILCESCPTCQGRGEIKTAQTLCYEIFRQLLRHARQNTVQEFRVLATQKVIDLLKGEEARSLADLSDFIGKPVSLQSFSSQPDLQGTELQHTQEEFEIILI